MNCPFHSLQLENTFFVLCKTVAVLCITEIGSKMTEWITHLQNGGGVTPTTSPIATSYFLPGRDFIK